MDRLNDRILALSPEAVPDIDFLLYQPPEGEVGIYNWNEAKLGKQPTAKMLGAVKLPEAGPAASRLTWLAFMDLFTEEEQLAIKTASMADAAIGLWYDRAMGASFIDLSDDRLGAGLQKLVDEKLITAARRSAVLKGHALS